jgi:hypothetical protein
MSHSLKQNNNHSSEMTDKMIDSIIEDAKTKQFNDWIYE